MKVDGYALILPSSNSSKYFIAPAFAFSPKGLMVVIIKFSSKNMIMEAYKSKNVVDGKVLYSNNNRIDSNNVLRFY